MRKIVYAIVVALIVVTACSSDDTNDDEDGASIAESVMAAWASGDEADVAAVYAGDVVMVLDGEALAENRTEIAEVIASAASIGNTYTQVGPVAVYEADGDMYVATLVEVAGAGHTDGDPLVGFYRVRDGEVIRHVFMYAPSS